MAKSDLRNDKMCEKNTHGWALLILIDHPDKQGPEQRRFQRAGAIIPTGLGRSLLVNTRALPSRAADFHKEDVLCASRPVDGSAPSSDPMHFHSGAGCCAVRRGPGAKVNRFTPAAGRHQRTVGDTEWNAVRGKRCRRGLGGVSKQGPSPKQ